MRRLPILFAVAVIVGGTIAAGYFALTDSDNSSAQAPTQIDLINAKLALNGEPTLPPDTTPFAPRPMRAVPTTSTSAATPQGDLSSTVTPAVPRCGPPDGAGSLAAVAASYGAIRDGCRLQGTSWIATTSGDAAAGLTGVVAVLECGSDAACIAGDVPASSAAWQAYEPPTFGEVVLRAFDPPDVYIVTVGRAQICFNLRTHEYDTEPLCR